MTRLHASTSIYRPPLTRRRAVFAITVAVAILVSGLTLKVFGDCLQLVIASSNEKSDLLERLAADYELRAKRVEQRCVHVVIDEVASGTAERGLATDWHGMSGPRPQVWSPASTTWLVLLDEDRRINGLRPIVPPASPSIVTSPLVIAMLEPMATAMRRSTPQPGWRDLVTLARDPAGWARFGGPWGAFKLAQTTPFISTSGLHALISIDDAAQSEADPAAFVRDLDASVLHYADSVRTFLGNLAEADRQHAATSYVSAIAVEEKQVYDYNRGNPNSELCDAEVCGRIPDVKLVALYPRDGTLFADHPFAILNWPDQEDAQLYAQAARDFLAFLEEGHQQDRFKSQGFRDDRTQPGPQLVKPYFDPDQPTHLNGVPRAAAVQQLRRTWNEQRRKPANAVVLLDVNPSLGTAGETPTKLATVKHAIVETLGEGSSTRTRELAERDALGLRTFPTGSGSSFREVLEVTPVGPPPTRFAASVKELAIERGSRFLYAAVRAAAEAVQSRYSPSRVNAVVLVTNGGNESTDRLDALTSWFEQQTDRRVLVFVVALPSAPVKELKAIVAASGGYLYEASNADAIPEFVRRALLNL